MTMTHDVEDDWEVAFDALHIQGASSDQIQDNELKDSHERKPNGVHHLDLQIAMLKPEYMYKNNGFGGRRGNSGRAFINSMVSIFHVHFVCDQ